MKVQWPPGWERTSSGNRKRGNRFTYGGRDVPYDVAYDLLKDELRMLGARYVDISSDDSGVVAYFRLNGAPRVMASDRYDTPAANMRSLGLAVAAMRQLERHGGGAMMDRAFAGFTALPPPRSCWEILELEPGSNRLAIERAFRAKALKHHPDQGGSDKAMAELNAARDEALRH